MPHGGYHGTVVMGGNIIQQGDGQGGIQGGIDDRSRLDKNPPSGGSGSGSSSPPMGSGPHSDGILSGWTENYIRVHVKSKKNYTNQIKKVKLINNYSINGVLVWLVKWT